MMAENKFLGTIVQPFVLQGHLPHILQIVTDSNGGSSRVQTAWRLLQSKIVGIDGRCDENLFSGTIAQQTRIFA